MAHQRPNVPKFGNWESEENVPYTRYFEKARMNKGGGKIINPNDPQENPDLFDNVAPQSHASPSRTRTKPEEPIEQVAVKPAHERRTSRSSTESAQQQPGGRGTNSGRPSRQSAGSDSIERSPLHPHYQGRVAGKGTGSPARDRKNSFESGQGTPGRSRLKPVSRGEESPQRGAAVPRFGEWDDKDPASAENYTHIFNKVREERQTATGNESIMQNKPNYNNMQKHDVNDGVKVCCFPWGRK